MAVQLSVALRTSVNTLATVYAFLGSYWHADPRKMPSSDVHPSIKLLNGLIHSRTMQQLIDIAAMGYNVAYIWEEDFKPIKGV